MRFQSLKELVETAGREKAERIFLVAPESETTLSFAQYDRAVGNLGMELKAASLQKGDKVAILLSNGLNAAVVILAVMSLGAVAVPLNPKLKPGELRYLLEHVDARYIVTTPELEDLSTVFEWEVRRLENTYEPAKRLILIAKTVSRFPAEKGGGEQDFEPLLDDVALILYTSGTTGQPKGVVLTHGNLLANADYVQQAHSLTSHDVALCVLPFFHINGFVVTLITPLAAGMTVIVPEKFSAQNFWKWIQSYRVSWFSAVPTILSILLSRSAPDSASISSLRFARSASMSLPVAVLREFEARFGVPVIESYGISEAGGQVTANPLPPAKRKPGSVGLPVGNQLRVIDDNGDPVPAGVSGEVVIRGRNVFQGYFHNLEASRQAFRNDWFLTGDLGFLDDEGYLFLTGRKKELINRAGEKISPREIEEVLYGLPEVETAGVTGVPDALFGEEIVAFLTLRPGRKLAAERVIAYCREYLAEFKIPRQVFFIGEFPRGPSGKIQRLKLVDVFYQITQGGQQEAK